MYSPLVSCITQSHHPLKCRTDIGGKIFATELFPIRQNKSLYCLRVSVSQDSVAMTGGTAAALPMSNHTRERVTVAKLTLENFYSTLLTQHEEREMR